MKISFGGEYRARNLTTAKDKIFVSATTSEEWVNVILNYNSAIGDEQYTISATPNDNKITYGKIQALKQYVDKYYEYVQFKRAKFDCVNIEYNQQTGRIIKMTFKFNGKFE